MSAGFWRLIAAAILALWLASLFAPVFDIGGERSDGLGFLLFGWMGLLIGELSWIANPLLLAVAWLLARGTPAPRRLLVCAVVLGVLFFVESGRSSIVDNEGGIERTIDRTLLGHRLWLAAIALAAVAALYRWALLVRPKPSPPLPYESRDRWEEER